MESNELLHRFLDGTLNNAEETAFYAELSSSADIQRELSEHIALRKEFSRVAAGIAPPVATSNAVFTALGFAPPPATRLVGGVVDSSSKGISKFLIGLGIGISLSAGLLLGWLWLTPTGELQNNVQNFTSGSAHSAANGATSGSGGSATSTRSTQSVSNGSTIQNSGANTNNNVENTSGSGVAAPVRRATQAAVLDNSNASTAPTRVIRIRDTKNEAALQLRIANQESLIARLQQNIAEQSSTITKLSHGIEEKDRQYREIESRLAAQRESAQANAVMQQETATTLRDNNANGVAQSDASGIATAPTTLATSGAGSAPAQPTGTSRIPASEITPQLQVPLLANTQLGPYELFMRSSASNSTPSVSINTTNVGLVNNLALGLFYNLSPNFAIGTEIGRESFGQDFIIHRNDSAFRVQQNPAILWASVGARHTAQWFSNWIGTERYVAPTLQVMGGRSEVNDWFANGKIGVAIFPQSALQAQLGFTYSWMQYNVENALYSSRTQGLYYSLHYRF